MRACSCDALPCARARGALLCALLVLAGSVGAATTCDNMVEGCNATTGSPTASPRKTCPGTPACSGKGVCGTDDTCVDSSREP